MRTSDKIIIKDLTASGILGVYEHERREPRQVLVNLTLYTDTRRAGKTDELADCVDYDQTAREIRGLIEGARRFTVEALAEDIASLCLSRPGVRQVLVRLEKPGAVPGTASVGVEIIRKK